MIHIGFVCLIGSNAESTAATLVALTYNTAAALLAETTLATLMHSSHSLVFQH
eukprot:c32706_g1_i1 orf=185-343(+)